MTLNTIMGKLDLTWSIYQVGSLSPQVHWGPSPRIWWGHMRSQLPQNDGLHPWIQLTPPGSPWKLTELTGPKRQTLVFQLLFLLNESFRGAVFFRFFSTEGCDFSRIWTSFWVRIFLGTHAATCWTWWNGPNGCQTQEARHVPLICVANLY